MVVGFMIASLFTCAFILNEVSSLSCMGPRENIPRQLAAAPAAAVEHGQQGVCKGTPVFVPLELLEKAGGRADWPQTLTCWPLALKIHVFLSHQDSLMCLGLCLTQASDVSGTHEVTRSPSLSAICMLEV